MILCVCERNFWFWLVRVREVFTAMKPTMLVVSAHAADFVWRAGGAIALYADRGYRVRVICLSYGERGESPRLWRQLGATLES